MLGIISYSVVVVFMNVILNIFFNVSRETLKSSLFITEENRF